jgi:acetyl esterase/lipase
VLDSVRAARQIPGLALDPRTLVWGHSQGGNAALWTGMSAAAYAPDVPLSGVAALSPASDLVGLMQEGKSLPLGKVLSAYALQAYGQRFGDIDPGTLANGWSRFWATDMARRCVGGWGTLLSVAEGTLLPATGIFNDEAFQGPMMQRLSQQTPTRPIPLPLLIGHGATDDLISVALQRAYVTSRCAAGQALDYREYDNRDHLTIVATDSPLVPELMQWSRDRFTGQPATAQCLP